MIDVHQNAALSESFEGDRSRVIGNRCNARIVIVVIEICIFMPCPALLKHELFLGL